MTSRPTIRPTTPPLRCWPILPLHRRAGRAGRVGSDAFETRVLLKETTCLKGPEAAALFYDPERFKREGAMPSPIRKTLLGEGGVQGLGGEAHRYRKQVFMDLMAPARVRALGNSSKQNGGVRAGAGLRGHRNLLAGRASPDAYAITRGPA